jgi:hypothetical protein
LEKNFLPNKEEVKQAIKILKNNRAPGPDDINAETIKVGKPVFLDRIYKIISCIWLTEKLPLEWKEGTVCPILKKETH